MREGPSGELVALTDQHPKPQTTAPLATSQPSPSTPNPKPRPLRHSLSILSHSASVTQVMHLRALISLAALAGLSSAVRADTTTLTDFFNGSSLDTTKWTASTPFSDSSVSVSGGNLILDNRGRLLSKAGFDEPIDLTMGFQITGNIHESFKVFLRTDGVSTNAPGEFDRGIFASFRIQSDTGQASGNITLSQQNHPFSLGMLATGTYALALNQTNVIRLTDDGYNVSLYINDLANPFLSYSIADSFGNQIGFFNREGTGAGSGISAGSQVRVDFVSITSNVPERGSTLIMLGMTVLGLVAARMRSSIAPAQHRDI